MKELLVATKLYKSYGDVHAVNGISLSINPGDLFGLVGPDGAGKTTTIRLLCGALRPDQGQVNIAEIPLAEQPDLAREKLGYLSQRFSLYEDLSVLENIRFFAEVRGLAANEWRIRALEILEFVGLSDFADRPAGKLSGGMKQKLGLASAMVHRPRLLLLDEPTGGVDPVTRQDFWQLIIRLVGEEGVGVLISTPYMDEAARCTRVGMLSNGRMIVEGSPSALRAQMNGRILELRGHPLREIRSSAARIAEIEDIQTFGDRLHLRVRPGAAQTAQDTLEKQSRTQGWHLEELKPVHAQLEDVFIALSSGAP